MARSTTTPAETTKAARRTPAQIAQADLDATLEKLDAAKARKERAETALASANAGIERLTALADYESAHPALKKAESDDVVTEPAGVTPVADA